MAHMRIGVYTMAPGQAPVITQRAAQTLAPKLRQAPGFVAYEIVLTGPDSGISLTTWETAAQADAAVGMIREWVQTNAADLVRGVVNHLGEVAFSTRGG